MATSNESKQPFTDGSERGANYIAIWAATVPYKKSFQIPNFRYAARFIREASAEEPSLTGRIMSPTNIPFDIEQHLYEHAIRSHARPPMRERIANFGHNKMVTLMAVGTMAVCAAFAMVGGNFAGPTSPQRITPQLTGEQNDIPQPAPDVNANTGDQSRQVAAAFSGF
jgi:hypothetical protein